MKKPLTVAETEALIERIKKEALVKSDFAILLDMAKNGVDPLEALRVKEALGKTRKDDRKGNKGRSRSDRSNDGKKTPRKKPKGHGRLGSADYTGAMDKTVEHDELKTGDHCPCCGGRLYDMSTKELINLISTAPITAIRYLLQRLRCSSCQKTFTANPPPEASYFCSESGNQ